METIEELTAAELAERLEELKERHAEIEARRERIRPPRGHTGEVAGPRYGNEPDPLEGAGPEYRVAALSDDPADLTAVREEWERLEDEGLQLAHRRHVLRQELERARREEAKVEAPEKARELMGALPDVLGRVDDALEELAAALDARDDLVRELDDARELAGGEPYWSPRHLRRLWMQQGGEDARPLTARQLRDRLSTRSGELEIRTASVQGGARIRSTYVSDAVDRLAPPEEGIFEALLRRVRTTLNPGAQLPERRREEVRREVDRVRARMIAEGDFAQLESAREVAVEAVRERHRAPGRKPPSREEVARRLS